MLDNISLTVIKRLKKEHTYCIFQENDDTIVYTNEVVNIYGTDVITRDQAYNISIMCTYNRTSRIGPLGDGTGSFIVTNYLIEDAVDGEGSYDFALGFYDATYTTEVSTYPIDVELNDDLYMVASVNSPADGDLDISVESCRATPTSDYSEADRHNFIENG